MASATRATTTLGELQCKERYLFACLGAVLSSGANSASELSIHALKRAYADLDNGSALESTTVASAVKRVIDLVTDSQMLDVETVKAFFLHAGLSTSEAQRCAKLAVVNHIPSPKKLSLLLFRDGSSSLKIFSLPDEEEILVRHALEQIYPVLVPPTVSMHRRLALGAAAALRETRNDDGQEGTLPMHAEEILARLKEVADSMTLTQMCSTLRQLLTLPDSSLADIVKAACKALGVKATGTLKDDAALCFFAAMEPAGGWKNLQPASSLPASPPQEPPRAEAAPTTPPETLTSAPTHNLSGPAVTVALPSAAPAQDKPIVSVPVPSLAASSSLAANFSPQRERRNLATPLSSSRITVLTSRSTQALTDGDAGTPGTPIFLLNEASSSGKMPPHHTSTPPLPTTVLPTLGIDRVKSPVGPGPYPGSPIIASTETEIPSSSAATNRPTNPSSAPAFVPPAAVATSARPSFQVTQSALSSEATEEHEEATVARAQKQLEEEQEDEERQRRISAARAESLEKQLNNASLARALKKLKQETAGRAGLVPHEQQQEQPQEQQQQQSEDIPSASPLQRQYSKDLASEAPTLAPTPSAPTAPLSPIVSPESAPSTPMTMLSCLMEDTRSSPDGRDWAPPLLPSSAFTNAAESVQGMAIAAVSTPQPPMPLAGVTKPPIAVLPYDSQRAPATVSRPEATHVQAVHATPINSGTTLATPSSSLTKTPNARPDMRPERSPATRLASPSVNTASPTAPPAETTTTANASINVELLPELLVAFYRRTNPSREKDVPSILKAYRGRELELVRKLEKQYSVSFL